MKTKLNITTEQKAKTMICFSVPRKDNEADDAAQKAALIEEYRTKYKTLIAQLCDYELENKLEVYEGYDGKQPVFDVCFELEYSMEFILRYTMLDHGIITKDQ